jgi:hypothetical protein
MHPTHPKQNAPIPEKFSPAPPKKKNSSNSTLSLSQNHSQNLSKSLKISISISIATCNFSPLHPNAQVSWTFFEPSVSVARIPREIKRNKWRRQFCPKFVTIWLRDEKVLLKNR